MGLMSFFLNPKIKGGIVMSSHMIETDLVAYNKETSISSIVDDHVPDSKSQQEENYQAKNWIRVKNNQIYVHHDAENGDPPLIDARHPLTLIINGQSVEGPKAVTGKDLIDWTADVEQLFHIHVSEDDMNAFLIVRKTEIVSQILKNAEPSSHVILELDYEAGELIKKLGLADITRELEQLSITQNIEVGHIFQELQEPTFKPVLVAHGSHPVPGVDGRLDLFFTEKIEKQFFEVDGLIDYRNSTQIPSVKKGEVIAQKIPPIEGIVGYNVYGQLLIPSKPQDIAVLMREHVEKHADGSIVAMKEGRPRITGTNTKILDISTSYIVAGNVDISTGNIVFTGDVIVHGDVTENMIIESLGNIYVMGSVYSATLTATGSIIIKGNAVKSNLYSGYFGVTFNRIYSGSQTLAAQLEQLIEASVQLAESVKSRGREVSFGQVILLLLDNKFKGIPQLVRNLITVIQIVPHQDKEAWELLVVKMEKFVQTFQNPQQITNEILVNMVSNLKEASEKIGHMKESSVKIDIGQCHLSTLKSNGDIVIRKEGVLQSDLHSIANIIFFENDAVCRGSKLEAGGTISAAVVGGLTGSLSELKAGKKIMLLKMFSGRVCVDNFCADLFDVIENETIDKNWIIKQFRPT
jgi:hypothetical protein